MKIVLVCIAAMLAIVGNVPYLRDVIQKKIQPHPYTWLMWSIVSAVTFFGQLQKGGGIGSIPTGIAEMFTIIIFLFSLRNSFKDTQRKDTYFLLIALLGLIPWALTKDPTLSVITVVSIDVIAFIPTLQKTWRSPESETSILFAMNVCRHILTLLSLETYNIATTLHSAAMIITNTVMVVFMTRTQHRNVR